MHLFCIGPRALGNWPYHSFMQSCGGCLSVAWVAGLRLTLPRWVSSCSHDWFDLWHDRPVAPRLVVLQNNQFACSQTQLALPTVVEKQRRSV